MSPLIEQHQPGPIELAWEPREEEAGPSSKGVGSDPAVSAVGLVQCFGSPRRRPVSGPGGRQPHAPPRTNFWWPSKLCNLIRYCWKRQGRSGRKRSHPGLGPSPWMLLWDCSPPPWAWLVAALDRDCHYIAAVRNCSFVCVFQIDTQLVLKADIRDWRRPSPAKHAFRHNGGRPCYLPGGWRLSDIQLQPYGWKPVSQLFKYRVPDLNSALV